jgi:hypothetical protein
MQAGAYCVKAVNGGFKQEGDSARVKRRSAIRRRHPSESWDPVPWPDAEGAGFQRSLE